MTNNLLEHVQEMTNDFERVITDHKSWHTNLGVPNWDVIKSHLLQSQLKSFELLKEEIGKLNKPPEIFTDDILCSVSSGYRSAIAKAITLLDTIIQDIKLQIK